MRVGLLEDDVDHAVLITQALHAAISRFARMNPPVIAAVGGTAAGAGQSARQNQRREPGLE